MEDIREVKNEQICAEVGRKIHSENGSQIYVLLVWELEEEGKLVSYFGVKPSKCQTSKCPSEEF